VEEGLLDLGRCEFKKEVRVGLVKRDWLDWLEVGRTRSRSSRLAECDFEHQSPCSSDLTDLRGRLTLGVLSPGDLQELLDVGDLLGLLFQIRP
jgi:hypothetical protein